MTALVVIAALVALGCALASARRLYFATNPIALHAGAWLDAIGRGDSAAVERAARENPRADWERDLFVATRERDGEARAGQINELMIDLDARVARWARVPRVCASVASSAGFLLGSLALRFGLVATNALPDDGRGDAINAVVMQAVNVAALGVAGAAFSIAAQVHARRASKKFQREIDAVIGKLESQYESKPSQN